MARGTKTGGRDFPKGHQYAKACMQEMKETQQEVINYFKDLPTERVKQSVADYCPEFPCCVGAHLANFFNR